MYKPNHDAGFRFSHHLPTVPQRRAGGCGGGMGVVQETVGSTEDLDEEMAHLFAALRGA